MGGNTALRRAVKDGLVDAPQWSRPVMGGNTRPGTRRRHVDPELAAMEPPGNGRKHHARLRVGILVQLAAMEPPGNRRKHSGTTPQAASGSPRRNGAAR